MSKPFNDPSLLTKSRLKEELEKNGIKLPRGEQRKEVYVNLYKENLSPQSSAGRLGNHEEFSSDDDGYEESPRSKQIVARSSRVIKKVGSKEIVSSDIKSMTDNELKDELALLGSPVGPILPTTRELYERKLARLRTTSQNNGETVTTLSKMEFSDNDDFDGEQEEQNGTEDEFFYKHNRRSGTGGFGSSTFTKNFQNTQKEVTHDVSMSSSRNVQHTSTVDRKTMNKVHTRKGDKVEERTWSSSTADQNASNSSPTNDEEGAMPALPATLQRALDSARRLSPEKSSNKPQVRERFSRQSTNTAVPDKVPKAVSKATSQQQEAKELVGTTKSKSSRRWWIIVVIILILIILTCAVVYNIEKLPELKRSFNKLTNNKKTTPASRAPPPSAPGAGPPK